MKKNNAGLVADPTDLAAFSAAALKLAESTALRDEMGRAARRYAESHFDIDGVTDRFEGILSGRA